MRTSAYLQRMLAGSIGVWMVLSVVSPPRSIAGSRGDTLALTLPGCIRMAQEHGPAGEMARQSYRSKEQSHRAFDAGFLPQLSLSGDAPGFYRSINSIVQPDGSTTFEQQRQASSSLGLQLSQKIAATGTELSLFSGLNRIDLIESDISYYRSTPLTLSLRQPIFSINPLACCKFISYFNS